MNETFSEVLEPVRHAVTVPLTAERAFALFTDGYNTWWPGHHIGTADLAEAILEPKPGGRYYERDVDGSECEWGTVLAFEPPHRIVVSWHLAADPDGTWGYDPNPAHASEFEVTFTPVPSGQTRVELEHRNFERHVAGAADMRRGVSGDGGWPGIMASYAKAAVGAA